MKKLIIITAIAVASLFIGFAGEISAQNVGVNSTGALPNSSAGLDVNYTDKGVLVPRLNTSQMNLIPSPANGLIIYNTDSACFCYYKTNAWVSLCSTNSAQADWTYFGKLTWINNNPIQSFTSLPLHDRWMLIFTIHNQGALTTDRILLQARVNGIATGYQFTRLDNSAVSNLTGQTGWDLIRQATDADNAGMGSFVLDGKHYLGVKKIAGINGAGSVITDFITKAGRIAGDSNDLTQIDIVTLNNITGQVELYFQDNK